MRTFSSLKKAFKKNLLSTITFFFICFFLLLPTIVDVYFGFWEGDYLNSTSRLVVSLMMFLIPLVFFYRNIKIYFFLLSKFIALTPLFIVAFLWFKARPNFSLVAFILQTNLTEVREVTSGLLKPFLLVSFVFLLVYLLAVKKLKHNRIPFKWAIVISTIATATTVAHFAKRTYKDNLEAVEALEETYPVSTISGITQAYSYIQKNNLEASKDFHFNAYKQDTLSQKQIYVLIIGESSRYDRWEINGYNRPTSPLLKKREKLISFSNVISGSNLTWMSVPQIITRATPDNIALQFREKSILSAFKDAGFKTVWLSNQSDKDIFWSGTITLHAKTADYSVFSPSESPNFDSYSNEYHDARLLPLLDSILTSTDQNIFLVMHMMGNHWDYSKRYPKEFDYFTPSGYTRGSLDSFSMDSKEAIFNSYDNSIRYSDYVIDSVISMVSKKNFVSTVTFISDHGEDLFEKYPEKSDFHVTPSPQTLHVPLFIWTSEAYNKLYPKKKELLLEHREHKIGAENTFYTLLDLANITYKGFDQTKSIGNLYFQESPQMYYDNLDKKAYLYNKKLSPASKLIVNSGEIRHGFLR